ncbi:MAG: histidine kinase [Gemmatimonadaceae bacterium]
MMLEHAKRVAELRGVGSVTDDLSQSESDAIAREGPRRLESVQRSLDVGRGARPGGGSGGPPRSDELDFLAGGGEMGERIRAYDWSATPLGAPGRWPRGLRNALRLLLSAPHPMSILWGRELLHSCNDACARLLGADGQARMIGAPARDLDADLRGPVLGRVVDDVMRRGVSRVVEDHFICVFRNGRAEETYLTCRVDPIADDEGATGGVSITLTETSDRVMNARRTAALRGLAAEAADAHSVEGACRCVLAELSRHPADVPFALLYVRDADGGRARLVATAGLPARTAASPDRIELGPTADTAGWPVAAAMVGNDAVTVDDLPARFGMLPSGDWPFAPRTALVLPLTPPGCQRPAAVLIVGVSARRPLDTEYRGFIELVARHVTAAIAAGRVHEEAERRAVAAAASAKLARARRRAHERALEARFAGVLEERTRMAREIHDTLLQGLTGIALQLRAMIPHVRTAPDEAADSLQRLVELADRASRDARRAVWDLRSPALARAGLPGALEQVTRRAAGGVALHFAIRGTPRPLPSAIEDTVLRVGQEAVVNAIKHAQARCVAVSVVYGPRAVRLAVVDDGRGFPVDPDLRSYAGHWGLLGMRERAERVGATLTVRSAVGAGTTVELLVPKRLAGAGR